MAYRITHVTQWVHDQDEALAFYTDKLGMEVREDATLPELGNFRWLSVGPPEQPDLALALLGIAGPPVFDEETAAKLRDLVAKGAAGGLFFATENLADAFEQLKANGVEIVQEPTEQPYGIDMAVRDPSGNQIRLAER
jgi:catechol 2,3-dioxygenase-like lactoylglutathione lyase family enzyme